MATMSKELLSGSTHGRGIKVTTTLPIDGSDTAIHTAVNSTTDIDLVTLYAFNDAATATELELGWGATSNPDDSIAVTIPPRTFVLVVADLPLRNNLPIAASASAANVVVVFGYVNRVDV